MKESRELLKAQVAVKVLLPWRILFHFFPLQVLLVFRYAAVELEECAWLSISQQFWEFAGDFLLYIFFISQM